MLDWFKKLMPKEEKFFDLFEAHAATAAEAARLPRVPWEQRPDRSPVRSQRGHGVRARQRR